MSQSNETATCAIGSIAANFSLGPDVSFRSEAEVGRAVEPADSVENDPTATSTDTITFPRRRFFGYLVGRCRIHDNAHNHNWDNAHNHNWTSQDRRSFGEPIERQT